MFYCPEATLRIVSSSCGGKICDVRLFLSVKKQIQRSEIVNQPSKKSTMERILESNRQENHVIRIYREL